MRSVLDAAGKQDGQQDWDDAKQKRDTLEEFVTLYLYRVNDGGINMRVSVSGTPNKDPLQSQCFSKRSITLKFGWPYSRFGWPRKIHGALFVITNIRFLCCDSSPVISWLKVS